MKFIKVNYIINLILYFKLYSSVCNLWYSLYRKLIYYLKLNYSIKNSVSIIQVNYNYFENFIMNIEYSYFSFKYSLK